MLKVLSDNERDDLIRRFLAAGYELAAPTVDELAELFTAPCLLDIARRRGFRIWLSNDHSRIEHDDEIPLWFFWALAQNYDSLLEHMQIGFLQDWVQREEVEV